MFDDNTQQLDTIDSQLVIEIDNLGDIFPSISDVNYSTLMLSHRERASFPLGAVLRKASPSPTDFISLALLWSRWMDIPQSC